MIIKPDDLRGAEIALANGFTHFVWADAGACQATCRLIHAANR